MARDLVLVGGIGPVLMPEGKILQPPLNGVVLGDSLFSTSNILESPNPPPVQSGGTYLWRTYVERIDLRTQQTTHRIDAGTVSRSGPGAYHEPGRAEPYLDGESVLLVRAMGEGPLSQTRFDRYRVGDGALLASRTVPSSTLPGESLVVGNGQVLQVTRKWADGARAAEWVLLGPDLSEVARAVRNEISVVPSDARTLAWTPACANRMPVVTLGAWIALCEGSEGRALLIADATTLRELGVVVIPGQAQLGRTIGWHVTPSGMLVLLTDLPGVIRVDLRAMQLLDARVVQQSPTTPLKEFSLYRDELRVTTAFSPDGRYAYLRQLAPGPRRFLTQIATDSAQVLSVQFVGQDVRAVHLSSDGDRLYALVADARYADEAPAWLVLLDARSLREILRSSPLAVSGGIIAVVRR